MMNGVKNDEWRVENVEWKMKWWLSGCHNSATDECQV